MSARASVADEEKKAPSVRFLQFWVVGRAFVLSSCSGGYESNPLVEFSTEINLEGDAPGIISRQLRAGVYLVEIRERDIDLRGAVDAGPIHTRLAEAYLRHGLHGTVVSLDRPQTLMVTLSSIDQRSRRGAAGLRILRWPHGAHADDIARSGSRADVVVLSGCATGDGRERNGSNTVVASLWPVEDALTARFMEGFYTAYRATGRIADALRTAQLKTRGTAAAAVWSSFVVRAKGLP